MSGEKKNIDLTLPALILIVVVLVGVVVWIILHKKVILTPSSSVSTPQASVNVPVMIDGLKITAVSSDSVVAEVLVKKEFLSAEEWAKRNPRPKPAKAEKAEPPKDDDMVEVDEETGLPPDD